jgi:hypothetical protein
VEEDYRRYAAETQFGEWDGVAGGVIEFVKGLGDGRLSGIETRVWTDGRPATWPKNSDITYPTCST